MSAQPAYSYDDVYYFMDEFGFMLDYAVNFLHYEPQQFVTMFLDSSLPYQIERGNIKYIAGMTGVEIAWRVEEEILHVDTDNVRELSQVIGYACTGSTDWWVGSMLAFYQWHSGRSFREILGKVPLHTFYDLYGKYHQMAEERFLERLDEICAEAA